MLGCAHASAGCLNCYAEDVAHVRKSNPCKAIREAYAGLTDSRGKWTGMVRFLPERLEEPARVKKPGRVFCGSMTDLGRDGVQRRWIREIAKAMLHAPWHQYIVCTKRPGEWLLDLPETCWVLTSIESQREILRWPMLYNWANSKAVAGVSVEPMLGPVSFVQYPETLRPAWVIAGPETGRRARPCEDAWLEKLAEESRCFHDKRKTGQRREWPVAGG